jgi:hypothetical protein
VLAYVIYLDSAPYIVTWVGVMNKKASKIKNILFEDTWSMFATQNEKPPAMDTGDTLGYEIPIEPTEMVADQLVQDRPPVEDNEFVPSNRKELGLAAKVIMQGVPDEKVAEIYDDLKKMIKDSLDKEEEDMAENKKNNVTRLFENIGKVKNIDTGDMTDDEVAKAMGAFDVSFADIGANPLYGGDEDDAEVIPGAVPIDFTADSELASTYAKPEAAPAKKPSPYDKPHTFDDLRDVSKHKNASGTRQWMEQAIDRITMVVQEMPTAERAKVEQQMARTFVLELARSNFIEEADAEDLIKNLGQVQELNSFRTFFTMAFMKIMKENDKNVEAQGRVELSKLGVPDRSFTLVFNQISGRTHRNYTKLWPKLAKQMAEKGYTGQEIAQVKENVRTNVNRLEQMFKFSVSPSDIRNYWLALNKGQRANLVKRSLKSTLEFAEDFPGENQEYANAPAYVPPTEEEIAAKKAARAAEDAEDFA